MKIFSDENYFFLSSTSSTTCFSHFYVDVIGTNSVLIKIIEPTEGICTKFKGKCETLRSQSTLCSVLLKNIITKQHQISLSVTLCDSLCDDDEDLYI